MAGELHNFNDKLSVLVDLNESSWLLDIEMVYVRGRARNMYADMIESMTWSHSEIENVNIFYSQT